VNPRRVKPDRLKSRCERTDLVIEVLGLIRGKTRLRVLGEEGIG